MRKSKETKRVKSLFIECSHIFKTLIITILIQTAQTHMKMKVNIRRMTKLFQLEVELRGKSSNLDYSGKIEARAVREKWREDKVQEAP